MKVIDKIQKCERELTTAELIDMAVSYTHLTLPTKA